VSDSIDGQVAHYELSRWREWCVERDHPGTTYNPLMGKTWCACGEVVTDGDTATHDLCCRVEPKYCGSGIAAAISHALS
jgi:hypothetical protein